MGLPDPVLPAGVPTQTGVNTYYIRGDASPHSISSPHNFRLRKPWSTCTVRTPAPLQEIPVEPLALTQPLWLSCPLPVLHCTLRQQPRVQWGIPLPILTSLQYGAVSLRPLKQMDLLAPHSRPVNTNGLPLQKEAIRLPADREATNCLTPQGSWGAPTTMHACGDASSHTTSGIGTPNNFRGAMN